MHNVCAAGRYCTKKQIARIFGAVGTTNCMDGADDGGKSKATDKADGAKPEATVRHLDLKLC